MSDINVAAISTIGTEDTVADVDVDDGADGKDAADDAAADVDVATSASSSSAMRRFSVIARASLDRFSIALGGDR